MTEKPNNVDEEMIVQSMLTEEERRLLNERSLYIDNRLIELAVNGKKYSDVIDVVAAEVDNLLPDSIKAQDRWFELHSMLARNKDKDQIQ